MYKNKIKKLLMNNKTVLWYTSIVYAYLKNYSARQHKVHYGENNPDKTFYVIRPRTNGVEGLMSLFVEVSKKLAFAEENGYIPYIDMKKYYTQYSNGIDNVWEYYFTQPSGYSEKEVYSSKNVILSGYTLSNPYKIEVFSDKIFTDKLLNKRCHELIFNNINYTNAVNELLSKELENIDVDECLGVYVRGTDYVKLRPVGEHVQPSLDLVINKIKEFENKYKFKYIYLVTEDLNIYNRLNNEFNNKIKIVSYDSFIKNYDGKTFLSKSNVFEEEPYIRGLHYLVKLIILSKCRYFIGSITMGSIASYVFNGNEYKDSYVFDLGLYK